VRTLNESEFLRRCISTIRSQTGFPDVDVVVVDSGSTDGTLDIARESAATLLEIEGSDLGDFDYSRALNLGIDRTPADVIVILSAHTIPVDGEWLARMTRHFEDPDVVGVYGRQVPWPDAHWEEVLRIARQFPDAGQRFEGACVQGMRFSNAASCIRRSAWEALPFSLPAGEDRHWAECQVREGKSIVYEAEACAYHSHCESARRRAKRIVNLLRSEDLRLGRTRTTGASLRESLGMLKRDLRTISGLEAGLVSRARYGLGSAAKALWFVYELARRPARTSEEGE